MSTWMKLSNGREEIIVNPDHIERLVNEGGVIIPGPTLPSGQATLEVSDQDDTQTIESAANEPEQAVVEDSPVVRKRGRQAKNS